VLGCLGDLVEDVVVRCHEAVHAASDTRSTVVRRRGGSAANVVESACQAGWSARFLGQVGDDPTGRWLTDALLAAGAEVRVARAGRSGTVVVLVDPAGERTMFADRAACTELSAVDPSWLDGLHTLHVPWYSFSVEPLRTTAFTFASLARERGLRLSVDLSSSALLLAAGIERVASDVAALAPDLVLANEQEAATMGPWMTPAGLGAGAAIVKHGADPAVVHAAGSAPVEVAGVHVADVRDTTGAGDAFAAGVLSALGEGADLVEACAVGHRTAAAVVSRVSADAG